MNPSAATPPAHPAQPRPVAIITGAGSGIGLHCARDLAHAGYRIALVGRDPTRLASALPVTPGGHATFPTDLADPAQTASLVGRVLDEMGRLDALVNNAGVAPLAPIHRLSDAEVAATLAVNLTAPLTLIRHAVPPMLRAGGGVIVNVSSRASADPFPGLGVYGAAKAGLNLLARALANDYADQGLRAYSVAPGAVETGMLRSLFDHSAVPPSQALDPADVARCIVACITGATTAANGTTIWLPSPAA